MSRLLHTLMAAALLAACVQPEDETQPSNVECSALTERAACEAAEACTWAQSDSWGSACFPTPDDCRLTGCEWGQTCDAALPLCLEPCPRGPGRCCLSWFQCHGAGCPDDVICN